MQQNDTEMTQQHCIFMLEIRSFWQNAIFQPNKCDFQWDVNDLHKLIGDMVGSPGACILKLITAIINSVTLKANVFLKASKKWLTIAKAPAYCTTELITSFKSFMVQAPRVHV